MVEKRLSNHDATPEGGCSLAFRSMLLDFVNERVTARRNTREALALGSDVTEKKDHDSLEYVAANVSGITSRQLQVCGSYLYLCYVFRLFNLYFSVILNGKMFD